MTIIIMLHCNPQRKASREESVMRTGPALVLGSQSTVMTGALRIADEQVDKIGKFLAEAAVNSKCCLSKTMNCGPSLKREVKSREIA